MALQFKVKKLVTVPLLKVPDNGTPIYVRIDSAIFQAKDNNAKAAPTDVDAPGKVRNEKPPMLAHITNLETGEVQQIIVGTVLESELKDSYPDDSYVGKNFEIRKSKPTGTKRYAMYQIAEIEVEGAEPTASKAKSK